MIKLRQEPVIASHAEAILASYPLTPYVREVNAPAVNMNSTDVTNVSEYRLCFFCASEKIENEQRVFIESFLNDDFREAFLDKIIDHYPNFPF